MTAGGHVSRPAANLFLSKHGALVNRRSQRTHGGDHARPGRELGDGR